MLHEELSLSPLGFLHESLGEERRGRTLSLDEEVPFFDHFQLHIVFRGIDGCLLLFLKVLFTGLLLVFNLLFPTMLSRCRAILRSGLLYGCRCVLRVPVGTVSRSRGLRDLIGVLCFRRRIRASGPSTRGFDTCSLGAASGRCGRRRVLLCKLTSGDRCLPVSFRRATAGGSKSAQASSSAMAPMCVSSTCTSGCLLSVNSRVALGRTCRSSACAFCVRKVCSCRKKLAIFLPRRRLGGLFSLNSSCFDNFLSSDRVASVSPGCVNSIVSLSDLSGVSERLGISVKDVVCLLSKFSVILFVVLVCLLSGVVVRGGTRSVSVAGVLKCSSQRVDDLCLLSAAVVIIIFLLLDFPVRAILVGTLFHKVVLDDVSN